MSKDELLALAERVEALAGPCREVDARIWCVLNGKKYKGHFEPYGIRDGSRIAVEYTEPPKRTRCVTGGRDGGSHAFPMTASLDAAMSLVPEGWSYQVSANPKSAYATVVHKDHEDEYDERVYSGHAATPALALTAAALRARAANQEQQP
jgi:hypothetical protein